MIEAGKHVVVILPFSIGPWSGYGSIVHPCQANVRYFRGIKKMQLINGEHFGLSSTPSA